MILIKSEDLKETQFPYFGTLYETNVTVNVVLDCSLFEDLIQLSQSRYRSGTVNSNTVNSKFHLIRSYCAIFFYNFSNISCLKYTVNSNFHLIRSKILPTDDFELTVPNL